ncbi:MAG TPA: hypothetical protein PLX15_05655 [Candidatus Woesearchaeota archaeon]|nr:hypothetical protein [Candidatus Woesearchaeota archaeon]
MQSVKCTININTELKGQLDNLVAQKYVASYTDGVNSAIALYLKTVRRELYAKQMEKAKEDKDFMERTISSQEAFANIDAEDFAEW